MEYEDVCFPEPLGCFTLPIGGPSSVQDNRDDDFADEFILSEASLSAALREQDPAGCFLCLADTLGDEE